MNGILIVTQTAVELGLIGSLAVLSLFLSYTMLDVCDLSTDGCFTLGAVMGALFATWGHPILSLFAAMAAGMISGFITAFLQTRMGVQSLLAGIIVNTGLYSINIMLMGGATNINMNKTETVFTMGKSLLKGSFLSGQYKWIVVLIIVILIVALLTWFLNTKLGMAIRATGNNPDMVRASSINPVFTTTVGLCVSGSFTALSGCLMAQAQKSAEINIGSGVLTITLASLLIGRTLIRKGPIWLRAIGAVGGAIVFRLVYTVALKLNMPAFMLKLVSSVIVVLALFLPYLKTQLPIYINRSRAKKQRKLAAKGGEKDA